MSNNSPTCGVILIGNELLSGRTQDANLQFIAEKVGGLGIQLLETRIIPDDQQVIVEAVNTLREKYSYVFTTGGIGPTHDDITVKAIAKAFDLPVVKNQSVVDEFIKKHGDDLPEATFKMAHFPEGAELIHNEITTAPGFRIDNVFALAGVPRIMKSMLEAVLPLLETGQQIHSKSVDAFVIESKISQRFEDIQDSYPLAELGSYPFKLDGEVWTSLVVRSSDRSSVESAFKEVQDMLGDMGVSSR